tara:strand:+ start:45 stop:653 length:609 start_codon:yes stop_codon:yes gene_type:complete
MSKKYIKINLNQVVSRFQLEEMKLERDRWYIAGGLTFCFICLFSFMNYTNYQMNKLIDIRQENIDGLNKKINLLQKESQINLSKKDIEILFAFESKRNYWTPKIQALADLTPIKMAITELEFAKRRLMITAITRLEEGVKEFDVIEDFINLIEKEPNFKDDFEYIKFINSSKERSKGQETFTFKIEAKMKKAAKKKRKPRKK